MNNRTASIPARSVQLLSERYRDDGRIVNNLSEAQRRERERFLLAIRDGAFTFEDVAFCPLCEERRQPIISCKESYGLPLQMTCCPGCGLVYVVRRLDDASLQRFYSEFYRNLYEANVATEALSDRFTDVRATKGHITQQIIKTLSLSPDKDVVVEIGAGGGWNLSLFAEHKFRAVGFDYDERLLELGRSRGIEMYNLTQGNSLSRVAGQASLLLAHEVLEHVTDPFSFLAELNAAIRPDGFLYLTVPSLNEIPFGYALGDPLQEFQLAHLFLFDESTLEAFLSMAGFKVVAPRKDLRLIAQRVGDPKRQKITIPANHTRNMRKLRFSENVARHFWTPLYNVVFGRRYAPYMKAARLLGMVLSSSRRRAFMDRRLRSGV